MAKYVAGRPGFLKTDQVNDIYSASSCISHDFCDWVKLWKHNGYWLFNSPEVIREIAVSQHLDLSGTVLFYYEAFEKEFDAGSKTWRSFHAEPSLPVSVSPPDNPVRQGYDIVSYSQGNAAECSPLSCNGMADTILVNPHCLLDHFQDAQRLLEAGTFDACEPGPYRIIAVYTPKK